MKNLHPNKDCLEIRMSRHTYITEDLFIYTNGADTDERLHFVAFHLDLQSLPNCSISLHSLPKHSFRNLVYKGLIEYTSIVCVNFHK